MEDLDAAEEMDYKQFYKDFYRPDNAILSIAGDIDIEQTKKLIDVYFKDIPRGKGEIQRKFPQEPPMKKKCAIPCTTMCSCPPSSSVTIFPPRAQKISMPCKMLGMLLSQGESSRMKKTIVDEQQKAVFAGSFPFELEDPGANIAFAIANMGVEPSELEKSMDAVIEDVQKNLIPEKNSRNCKTRWKTTS